MKMTRRQIFTLGVCTGIIATTLIYKRLPPETLWLTPGQILAIGENLDEAIRWNTTRGIFQVRVLA